MNRKKFYCIILLLFVTLITHALTGTDQLPGLETGLSEFDRLIPGHSFLFLTPLADDAPSTDGTPSAGNKKNDGLFARILFTYLIPITYFSWSIINKEIIYTDSPEDNYLRYINAPITSILAFGMGGFFAGLTFSLICSDKDNYLDMFLYPIIVASLLGLTGMIGGGIYALMDYDNIVTNDLFYYGGPMLMLFVPIGALIRTIAED